MRKVPRRPKARPPAPGRSAVVAGRSGGWRALAGWRFPAWGRSSLQGRIMGRPSRGERVSGGAVGGLTGVLVGHGHSRIRGEALRGPREQRRHSPLGAFGTIQTWTKKARLSWSVPGVGRYLIDRRRNERRQSANAESAVWFANTSGSTLNREPRCRPLRKPTPGRLPMNWRRGCRER